jgi:hypothetical protein
MDYSGCGLLVQHCSCLVLHSSATTTLRGSSGTPMIGGPRLRYSFHNSVPTLVASPVQTIPPNKVADRTSRTHSINVGMRFYPEYNDVSDSKLYPFHSTPGPDKPPWATLGTWAAVAFGIPLAVLALGPFLVWAFSGFAAKRNRTLDRPQKELILAQFGQPTISAGRCCLCP